MQTEYRVYVLRGSDELLGSYATLAEALGVSLNDMPGFITKRSWLGGETKLYGRWRDDRKGWVPTQKQKDAGVEWLLEYGWVNLKTDEREPGDYSQEVIRPELPPPTKSGYIGGGISFPGYSAPRSQHRGDPIL